MNDARTTIIGAGWAGISAAHSLLAQGVPPNLITIFERAPHPGGRAFSFDDEKQGLTFDNGQHVLLGCCDQFADLLSQLGIRDAYRLQPLLHIPVYCDGAWGRLSSKRLAGALHLLPGLLTYAHLRPLERVRALRVAPQFLRPDVDALDGISFGDWLRQNGQTDRAIGRLWDLVGTAVLNGHADEVSAALALESFRMGVVAGWQQARLGLFTRPLGDLAAEAITKLQGLGVEIRFNTAVTELQVRESRVTGVRLRGGDVHPAETVIAAVPHDALVRMLPSGLRDDEDFARLASLTWSPILNAFVLYDRPVMGQDVFASMELGGMFVFNRASLLGLPQYEGRWLSVSISAAHTYRGLGADELAMQIRSALAAALPQARAAQVEACKLVWQPHATFLASPGSSSARANPTTSVKGLFVAGDWTNTGWPASLEGAVRSGIAAVEARLGHKLPQTS